LDTLRVCSEAYSQTLDQSEKLVKNKHSSLFATTSLTKKQKF
jgi:hypothetical protein